MPARYETRKIIAVHPGVFQTLMHIYGLELSGEV